MASNPQLNILHAIHDFLPRHQAGSELYALALCRQLQIRHHVAVLCAEYDPSRAHGSLDWRMEEGIPVVEVANNWVCDSFADTYRSPLIGRRIEQVLDAVRPDVVHVHNLLSLSFDLPALARRRGIPVTATLHDYTLVCPSGGQRIHRAEEHVCHRIDVDRCARCFPESPFSQQMAVGRLATSTRSSSVLPGVAKAAVRTLPSKLVGRVAGALGRGASPSVTPRDIFTRLDAAREVFEQVDVFVAPSASIAREYEQLGVDPAKLKICDYGFQPLARAKATSPSGPMRIGYVGSLVWHKGVHVLLDAARSFPESGWSLEVFGDPAVAPDYVDRLRTMAAGLPVRFHGAFARDRAAEVFSQLDLLVVPSLWIENSPLVIHEAFMAGVPVVGARIGGVADLIRHGVDGVLYEPTDAGALGAAVTQLVRAPDRLRELGAAAPEVRSMVEDASWWEEMYRCCQS